LLDELLMATEISFRAAQPADAYALAELSIAAGDGMYEFLLGEMAPAAMLAGLISRTMKSETGGFSFRHCFVAVDQGVIAGMVNAFPAQWLQEQDQEVLPADRVQVLAAIDQAQDWQSFLVNGIAVRRPYRRQGIGKQLLRHAIENGKAQGFPRLTANVWAANPAGRGLFASQGFQESRAIEVAPHPALAHKDGCLLLSLDLTYDRGTAADGRGIAEPGEGSKLAL
jgi:GNAT superfamily N-acetyltransferase